MANARLHLICGNCGCNDKWKWQYIPKDSEPETVWVWCENCDTLHDLADNAQPVTNL